MFLRALVSGTCKIETTGPDDFICLSSSVTANALIVDSRHVLLQATLFSFLGNHWVFTSQPHGWAWATVFVPHDPPTSQAGLDQIPKDC